MNGLGLAAIVIAFFVAIPVWAGVSDWLKSRKPFDPVAWTPPVDVDARHRTAIVDMFAPTTPGGSKWK